ncbi:beta-ketoacyl synthase N-terminal-like domain-containing protein [Paraliobacillus ryukyuensis]|uniref:beta-ketoacyl synthase N-terminal-like domain-containing protein n=1 Tax=Paraliobacillus ryukyuensis TaxID=200904 RepID=UPI0009A60799|nr:beta-ketoacyl synthase N-terminal-like domain-containing protein [Paraliobacillus ryukyuensis]
MTIVVTGYGMIAPKTPNIKEYLFNLQHGLCSLELVKGVGYQKESNIVGIIKEGIEDLEKDRRLKRLPKVSKLGMKAAEEALESADINLKQKNVGLFFGISLGASGEKLFQETIQHANNDNYKKVPVTFTHYANYHSITASIAHYLQVKGVTKTITTGCTSSLEAIEDAMLYLQSGKIDVAIVGGADSPLSKATTYAFSKTKVLPLNQSLDHGAVPFHGLSKGFAMSEAAGVVILERAEDAQNRGADIKGEIVDIVSNNDGVYIYSLDESGEQMISALRKVVKNRTPDYINSQALGIQLNDQIERKSSRLLFEHKIPYTSIKSMYGNPFGAIGILQVIASLLSIQHGFIPPTIRTDTKGYEEMNIVTKTKFQKINEVAITNHGYGGNNACAYIKRYSQIATT